MVPSRSPNQISNDLFEFLRNNVIRKKYNKVLGLAKKFRIKEAKIEYLKACIEEKLISTDFKLSKPKHNYPIYDSVRTASETASIEVDKVCT